MPKFFLLMNPSARSFESGKDWMKIFEILRARNVGFDFGFTEKGGDSGFIVQNAIRSGFDTIVAVGGDGTINETINCLFGPEEDRARATMGVIYTGTSPDFCRYHKIPLNTEVAINLLLSGQKTKVDVCRIQHYETPNGKPVSRIFSCSSNFGLGAAVARGANSGLRKRWGDSLGTFLSLVSAIYSYRPSVFRLKITGRPAKTSPSGRFAGLGAPGTPPSLDGRENCFHNVFNIFIGKNPIVASGIKLKMDISHDDGRLYILPLHGISRTRVLGYLPHAYTGSIAKWFPPIFASEVEILTGDENLEVEYDGDPRGFLPAKIKVLPKALELVRAA